MAGVKGTRTERNLLAAFAGESQARNRYSYFAKKAHEDGFVQVSAIFEETADQEMQHAKRFFKHLEGGQVEITATYPAGKIGTTVENLRASAEGEHHEWSALYPEFAKIAREDKLEGVARLFEAISTAEQYHEERFTALLASVEAGKAFTRSAAVTWRCLKCGYVHEGTTAPQVCPACAHPQAYFEVAARNW